MPIYGMGNIIRREIDMELTLKENIKTNSLMLKHNILLQASELIMGREGVLQTEKELYLMLAMVNQLIEEDLIALCNEDGRELEDIVTEDIEPFFENIIIKEEYKRLYNECKDLFLARCKEIWDNQHSIVGVIDAIMTTIATMTDEDKKEALVETGKIAEKAFERRTEVMSKKADETNSKLAQLMEKYQTSVEETDEENNAE